jgi:hypothetical protein
VRVTDETQVPMRYRTVRARIDGPLWERLTASVSEEIRHLLVAAIEDASPSHEAIREAVQDHVVVPGAEVCRGSHLRVAWVRSPAPRKRRRSGFPTDSRGSHPYRDKGINKDKGVRLPGRPPRTTASTGCRQVGTGESPGAAALQLAWPGATLAPCRDLPARP